MNPIQSMMVRVEMFDAIKSAIGRALNSQQQISVSAKLAANQSAFLQWADTDAGRAAIRTMADAFTFEQAKPTQAPEVKP